MELSRPFGARVKALRQAKLMTQEDLAEATGLAVRTVRNIEAGRVSPTLTTVGRLAEALEVAPKKLFEFGS